MKKSYERPEIDRVKLAAEEAVLTNCKVPPPEPTLPGPCNPNVDPLLEFGS